MSSFVDKRELQANLPPTIHTRLAGLDEVTVDFMSDTGDGYDATYTMASLISRRELRVDGHSLPRGRLLLLGGDQVYPIPGPTEYEDRFQHPFQDAFPSVPPEEPTLLAIPGNHDWYDGLTSFLRVVGQGRNIGGWKTIQRRSYFAVQLPHRWWIWGVDIPGDTYIDEPQLEFFEEVCGRMREGDHLIVVTATPTWVDLERDPEADRNLAYLERKLMQPNRLELMLVIAGDSHHYARYSSENHHRVTSGGGGAFLHPTHDLPDRIDMVVDPGEIARADKPAPVSERSLWRKSCYPSRARSRWLALLAILLPLRNVGFIIVPGVFSAMLLWSNHFGNLLARPSVEPTKVLAKKIGWYDYLTATFRTPTSVIAVLVVLVALIALADSPPWASGRISRPLMKLAMGSTHTVLLYVTVTLATLLAIVVVAPFADRGWFAFWLTIAMLVFGGVLTSAALGFYFAFWNACPGTRVHGNEAFAASRLTSHKNFLRMQIDATGNLVLHAIGVRHIGRRSRKVDSSGSPEHCGPVWAREPSTPHLIESVPMAPPSEDRT